MSETQPPEADRRDSTDGLDVEAPRNWELLRSDPEANEIVLGHVVADYQLEVQKRPEDVAPEFADDPDPYGPGEWQAEYVDPNGTRRFGTDTFHGSPQAAIDDAAAYIQTERADRRNQADQQREAEDVEWPDQIGGFGLVPGQASAKKAVYAMNYLRSYTILGSQMKKSTVEIRWYSDTQMYHVGDETFGRKQTAIDAAREIMQQKTEKYRSIEAEVVENNDVPEWRVPDHLKD